VRFVAVLDGTLADVADQARALSGFLGAGLTAGPSAVSDAPEGETVVFYADAEDRDRLVELAPTPVARLVRAPACRPDHLAGHLAGHLAVADGAVDLVLFAGGSAGAEVAARLARRTGGGVATEALDVALEPDRLVTRRRVYSNHMVGRFSVAARPWCVTLDPSWTESPIAARIEHRVLSEEDVTGDDSAPFTDVELGASPSTSDLAEARVVLVAGAGAGGRDGVSRLAGAARRMGAAFGVTRPVAMNAWAPVDRLIGVSGARVAPALAVLAGVSGAPALLWGIERAGMIVAVNTDDRAPIVQEADVTVVGDGVAVAEALADLLDPPRSGQ
jgi:electron transfer flavoprotein alpha subunit